MDIAALTAGQTLPRVSFTQDRDTVESYRQAVEDSSPVYAEEPGLVPPMAPAALVIRELLRALSLPPGTIHSGQELIFSSSLPVGAQVICDTTISQNGIRGGWRLLSVEFSISQEDGPVCVAGRSTLLIPEE